MQWDVFCRVIDNFGDIGVCWRLAADLAARGEAVRLWVDDARALRWMAPRGAPGVSVHPWQEAEAPSPDTASPDTASPDTASPDTASPDTPLPGDVVIEAFGCELPPRFVERMAARQVPPTWINLEYLSAEPYVERSHRLPSPQLSGPGQGLTKWFFYPGFTAATGGLLREPGLMESWQGFDRLAWLQALQIPHQPGDRLVSVFAYPHAPLAELMHRLADAPTLWLLTPGAPVPAALPVNARVHSLPYLDQPGYDRLLWACDLNLVRGEDSFVRAQWAGRPFVWHIYPQDDGAHAAKLNAFLDRFSPPPGVRELWLGWNGLAPLPAQVPLGAHATALNTWAVRCQAWREELLQQQDLAGQLLGFVTRSG